MSTWHKIQKHEIMKKDCSLMLTYLYVNLLAFGPTQKGQGTSHLWIHMVGTGNGRIPRVFSSQTTGITLNNILQGQITLVSC